MCVCVCVCVRARARARVCAHARMCVHAFLGFFYLFFFYRRDNALAQLIFKLTWAHGEAAGRGGRGRAGSLKIENRANGNSRRL